MTAADKAVIFCRMVYFLIEQLEGELLLTLQKRARANRRSVADEAHALLAGGLEISKREERRLSETELWKRRLKQQAHRSKKRRI